MQRESSLLWKLVNLQLLIEGFVWHIKHPMRHVTTVSDSVSSFISTNLFTTTQVTFLLSHRLCVWGEVLCDTSVCSKSLPLTSMVAYSVSLSWRFGYSGWKQERMGLGQYQLDDFDRFFKGWVGLIIQGKWNAEVSMWKIQGQ